MSQFVTRREAIAASLAALGATALTTTTCSVPSDASRHHNHAPRTASAGRFPVGTVSIARASGYTQEVYDVVLRMLAEHKLDVHGKRIVLKPNLVEFDENTCINTSPLVVHAAFEAFRRMGAASVRIAEGPGHRRGTLDLADAAGYFSTIREFENSFTDLNLDEVAKRDIAHPVSGLKSLYLPHTVLDCDLLVSIPKLKTHHWAGATLAMKNLFGVVPGGVYGWPKNVLHWAGIPESIVDLHHLFPKQFALVDGIVGMEGNGPVQGTPKFAGVLVAGADVAAVDATCCRVMGLDPAKIDFLKLARGPENLTAAAANQIGETIASVQTNFALVDEWKHIQLML